jgi:hypothetical protein
LGVDRWKWNYNFSLHEYRNNPTPYKLKDLLHFLQLPCFYIWTPYQASEYNPHFPILIIFKIDNDGSALRVGAKYKSFTDLESALKKFHRPSYL